MQPNIRWMKPKHKNKNNAVEKLFTRFTKHWEIECSHEPRFFYDANKEVIAGHSLLGYCPDYYLRKYRVYVELYQGDKSHANRYEIGKKRQRIRWLSANSGRVVVLIHLDNFPMDREDLERLIKRARKEARAIREEVELTGKVYELPQRHRSPGKGKSKKKSAAVAA